MRRSRSRKIVGIWVLSMKFCRSLLARPSWSTFDLSSSLTVASSSFVDWSSSFIDIISSFELLSSSFDVSEFLDSCP